MSKLKTARVGEALEEDFLLAEQLVSNYFRDRTHDPTRGTIEISGERYVLVRGAALSVEFFDLVEKLYGGGREAEARDFARNILFDLAHAIGRSDAKTFHVRMRVDDPVSLMAAGPIHFAHSGWAFVDIDPNANPDLGANFSSLYDHPYSFESDAWLRAGRTTDFPVCIMSAGYSSGWCEEAFDTPLVAAEVLCRARGDEHCRFIMAAPERLERRVEEYIATKPALASRIRGYQIPDFFARKHVEEELRAARDELEQKIVDRTLDLRLANERLRSEMRERERIQRQLQNTQRLESLGRLAGGVAHDFNNLLGVIIGYSSILQRRMGGDEAMQSMLGEITDAAQLAAQLTKQLLTFSRARVAVTRKVDLNEIVSSMTNMLRRFVGDAVRLHLRIPATPAVIEADRSQIEQMLLNLTVNARDAMPQGGTLRIMTALIEPKDHGGSAVVELSVADTGVGMDDATQSRIFEPFFTTKQGAEGTGLGLSTVYGIVAQAGGVIRVDSEPGLGTEFIITLPIAAGDADATLAESQGVSLLSAARGETVLLCEDRVGFRALVANLLGDSGYKVLVAHDADDALRIGKLHPGNIHALVTDVVMPKMNGRQLAQSLRRERPDVRVLFMSGYDEDLSELDAAGGKAAFIRKPFTPEDLDRELRKLLD